MLVGAALLQAHTIIDATLISQQHKNFHLEGIHPLNTVHLLHIAPLPTPATSVSLSPSALYPLLLGFVYASSLFHSLTR